MKYADDYMLPCLNKKIWGVDCLGCGMQRSAVLIVKGEFVEAFYMYPAIYFLIPLAIVIGLSFFYKFKNANKIINSLALVSVVVIIFSFVLKKI